MKQYTFLLSKDGKQLWHIIEASSKEQAVETAKTLFKEYTWTLK